MYWCDPESGVDFTPRKDLTLAAGVTLRNPLPNRETLGPGFAPRGKENACPEWNIRNGLQPKWRGKDAFTAKWGVDPMKMVGGSLGDRIWNVETNKTEIAAEIARILANGDAVKYCSVTNAQSLEMLAKHNLALKRHPERFPLINGRRCFTGTSTGRISTMSSSGSLRPKRMRSTLTT